MVRDLEGQRGPVTICQAWGYGVFCFGDGPGTMRAES